VHTLEAGSDTPLYFDPLRCFLFDAEGNRVAAGGPA